MSKEKIPYKIYLEESEMPKAWYNLRADMVNKPAPLLNPGTLVRRLRLVARYEGEASAEKDLYYHLPGFGYTSRLRVWPTAQPDGSWLYTLPRFAGQGLRLDLADTAGVAVELTAIVLNERQPWQEYFIPSAWQLFWLAVLPGLAGCALTLKREKGEDD